MRARPFAQVDVFSDVPLRGNPVAVVFDADGLSTAAMQAFCDWTNLSEATFLLPATVPAAEYAVRRFSPGRELPFAGHPIAGYLPCLAGSRWPPALRGHGHSGVRGGSGADLLRRRRPGVRRTATAAQRPAVAGATRPGRDRAAGGPGGCGRPRSAPALGVDCERQADPLDELLIGMVSLYSRSTRSMTAASPGV